VEIVIGGTGIISSKIVLLQRAWHRRGVVGINIVTGDGQRATAGAQVVIDVSRWRDRLAAAYGEYFAPTRKLIMTALVELGRAYLIPVLADFLTPAWTQANW